MKKNKIIYWTTTGLISGMMLLSAMMYFTAPEVKAGFTHLGYPSYFRVELAIAKLAGALALLLPFVNWRIKEWAYFGFLVTFISALISHIASGDPANVWSGVIVAIVLLSVSYIYYRKMNDLQISKV